MRPARQGAYWYCYLGADGIWKICHHGEVMGDCVIRETELEWYALAFVRCSNNEEPLTADELQRAGYDGDVSALAVSSEYRHRLADVRPKQARQGVLL
jgi:hypothetical protein